MPRRLTSLLILTLLTLAACGSDDAASGDTGSGEDGDPPDLVTATVNGIAVSLDAHGQTLDEPITIEAIEPTQGAASDTFVAAFRLLPAGATFRTPVVLSLTIAGAPGIALTGLHFSDGPATELLAFRPVAYDSVADATTYATEVTHFSEIQVERRGYRVETRILPDIPGDRYLVGDSFTMRVRVVARSLPSWDRGLYKGTDVRIVSNRPPVLTFQARWQTAGAPLGIDFTEAVSLGFLVREDDFAGSPLDPTKIDGRPPTQSASDGQSLTYEQEFRCVSPGRFFVWFRGTQTQPGVATEYQGTTVLVTTGVTRYGDAAVAITGECILPEASSTPTPGTALTSTPVAAASTGTTAAAIPTIVD